MAISDLLSFGVFLLANFAAASSGAYFKPDTWYENLDKPSWNPPNWLFPVAWTILYVMIATAGWLVWDAAEPGMAMLPLAIYGVHLVLNFAWSAIFFGMKRMDLAFYELILLWLSLAAVIVLFHPISATAAYLLVPYLLWVSFAGLLNFNVWQRNKAQLSKAI